MPAISQLSITDGTDSIDLDPIKRENGVTTYRETGAPSRAAASQVQFSHKESSNAQRQYVKFTVPYSVEDADTLETVVRENSILSSEFRFPDILPSEDRAAIVAKYIYLLGNAAGLNVEITTGQGQW